MNASQVIGCGGRLEVVGKSIPTDRIDAGDLTAMGVDVHQETRGKAPKIGRPRELRRPLLPRAEAGTDWAFWEPHGFVPVEHPGIGHFRLVGKR